MSLGQNVSTFFSMGQQKTVQIPTGTANVTYVTVPVRQGVPFETLVSKFQKQLSDFLAFFSQFCVVWSHWQFSRFPNLHELFMEILRKTRKTMLIEFSKLLDYTCF